MKDKPITKEELKQASRAEQKAAIDQAELRDCQRKINQALQDHGCEIVCVPAFTADGRIVAQAHVQVSKR